MVKLLFFHLGVTNSKLKNIKLHLKLLTGKLKNKILISNHNHSRFTLFVPIFARTNFRALAQKNPFERENQYRIYAEKGYARNLIREKIISFHLIHFEPFQKLLLWFKGNIYFFIRFKKN